MIKSVEDRVKHRCRIPVSCDACDSQKIALQSRSLMGIRTSGKWPLVWHCETCGAMVGCHTGTDIPLGLMADRITRDARYRAHKAFDPLWKNGHMVKANAYAWMAKVLGIPFEQAHIGMLNETQCEQLIKHAHGYTPPKAERRHWSQDKRKKGRQRGGY